jgi:hypothetical protein
MSSNPPTGTDQKLAVIINDLKDIKPQVKETNDTVIELQTDMKNMGTRVTKVEDKVERGHDCYNVEIISELKTHAKDQSDRFLLEAKSDAEHAEKLKNLVKEAATLEADVKDIQRAPRRMFYAMMGIFVTLLTGAGGAVWFLSGLNTELKEERVQRAEQIQAIRSEIGSVGDIADTTPIQTEVSELREVVESSNGHEEEFNALCDGMRPYVKRFMRDSLIEQGKRVPSSCREGP